MLKKQVLLKIICLYFLVFLLVLLKRSFKFNSIKRRKDFGKIWEEILQLKSLNSNTLLITQIFMLRILITNHNERFKFRNLISSTRKRSGKKERLLRCSQAETDI